MKKFKVFIAVVALLAIGGGVGFYFVKKSNQKIDMNDVGTLLNKAYVEVEYICKRLKTKEISETSSDEGNVRFYSQSSDDLAEFMNDCLYLFNRGEKIFNNNNDFEGETTYSAKLFGTAEGDTRYFRIDRSKGSLEEGCLKISTYHDLESQGGGFTDSVGYIYFEQQKVINKIVYTEYEGEIGKFSIFDFKNKMYYGFILGSGEEGTKYKDFLVNVDINDISDATLIELLKGRMLGYISISLIRLTEIENMTIFCDPYDNVNHTPNNVLAAIHSSDKQKLIYVLSKVRESFESKDSMGFEYSTVEKAIRSYELEEILSN